MLNIEIFNKISEMSINVSITIILVLILRLLLKKYPKKYSYFLWFAVLFRMICPISINSIFSIYNVEKVLTPAISNTTINNIITFTQPEYYTNALNLREMTHYYEIFGLTYNSHFEIAIAWFAGIILLTLYSISSYDYVKQFTKTAIHCKENIYQSEHFKSPFVIGYFKPKIIIPYGLDEKSQQIIIEHEKIHIRRKDNISRMLFYIACIVYCLNPLVWIAYHYFCKDMEMSCDEEVLLKYNENNKTYSNVLLDAATEKQYKLSSPLAFSEKSVKERIINVLKWKKPGNKKMILGICICLFSLLAFTTNPTSQYKLSNLINDYNISNIKQINIENYNLNTYKNLRKYEITSWLHMEKLINIFDYVEVSKQSIKPSNDEIDSTYTIIDENDHQIIIKFNKDYSECRIESNGSIKSYRIKNNDFTYENLSVGELYESLRYAPIKENQNVGYENKLYIVEKNHIYNYKYAFVQIKMDTDDGYYYSIKCDYVVEKDRIIFRSMEDENVLTFNIIENNGKYRLIFNESESNVIYKDMLDKLRIFIFEENNW